MRYILSWALYRLAKIIHKMGKKIFSMAWNTSLPSCMWLTPMNYISNKVLGISSKCWYLSSMIQGESNQGPWKRIKN